MRKYVPIRKPPHGCSCPEEWEKNQLIREEREEQEEESRQELIEDGIDPEEADRLVKEMHQ